MISRTEAECLRRPSTMQHEVEFAKAGCKSHRRDRHPFLASPGNSRIAAPPVPKAGACGLQKQTARSELERVRYRPGLRGAMRHAATGFGVRAQLAKGVTSVYLWWG